jgi:hypothetical protein
MNRSARLLRAPLAVVALAALSILALAPSAQAQGYARTFALSGFAGYNIASDIYSGYSGTYGEARLEMKNGLVWGGRIMGFTNDYSAVEFGYARTSSDISFRPASSVNNVDAGNLSTDEYDLNFLISQPSPNPRMWPYFTLGFGWAVTHPEVHASDPSKTVTADSNTLFAFNFGIGTLVEVKPNLSLRLDARWRVTDTAITTSSGVYCDYWGYCWSYASDWYNSGELTAGLTYRMGSK